MDGRTSITPAGYPHAIRPGKLRITLDFRIELAADLSGSEYWRYHGQLLSLPTDRIDWPSAASLAYRRPAAEAGALEVSVPV